MPDWFVVLISAAVVAPMVGHVAMPGSVVDGGGEVFGDKSDARGGDNSGTTIPPQNTRAPQVAVRQQLAGHVWNAAERGRFEL
jgi:hypothetical protein